MDANEYALKLQPAAKSLGLTLRSAVWMGAGDSPPLEVRAEDVAPPLVEAPAGAANPRIPSRSTVAGRATRSGSPRGTSPGQLPRCGHRHVVRANSQAIWEYARRRWQK